MEYHGDYINLQGGRLSMKEPWSSDKFKIKRFGKVISLNVVESDGGMSLDGDDLVFNVIPGGIEMVDLGIDVIPFLEQLDEHIIIKETGCTF